MSDKEVNEYLPLFPLSTIDQARKYLQNNYLKPIGFNYAICLKTDNVPVGYVNSAGKDSYDLGYGLKKEYWHKGIVTEACRAVVEQAKKSGIPFITATHDVNNPRSGNVMKNIGMTYRYSYEEQWQPKNILVTFRMYQINFTRPDEYIYRGYWERYPVHFVEKGV